MLIDGFNDAWNIISAIYLMVEDESTNTISFRMMVKGNLPHLYYIFCKPELLGTEFKTVPCSVTGLLL